MKKLFCFIITLFFSLCLFSQNFTSVDLSDKIYEYLEIAKVKGFCSNLTHTKPYTQSEILTSIEEILKSEGVFTDTELQIFTSYKEQFTFSKLEKNSVLKANSEFNLFNSDYTARLFYNAEAQSIFSTGLYTNKDFSSWGMDNLFTLNLRGDVANNFSFGFSAIFDVTRMPLQSLGTYDIGYLWYNREESETPRQINVYKNNSYLPYAYSKPWGGQMYLFSNMSASGLEGWPTEWGLSGTTTSEIRASFLDDNLKVAFGRYRREVAGMQNDSSLVLNSNAQPFVGVDFEAKIGKYIKFSSLVGVLEYPNQDYINEDALPKTQDLNIDDTFYFQNAFSMNMLEFDYKYLHLDFGGTVVWPKRFELGYMFPLLIYVEYQNHIGDNDNLSLFGDFKFTLPNTGSVWASLYLDEINGLNNNPLNSTRAMFAYQAGINYIVPKLSFSNVSFSYTKIEPYCYTHHAINYTPWYNHYICENYTNNGENLGYYLPPNSDEFKLNFNWTPNVDLRVTAGYQYIRHGADYGSQQVPGSSLYSELQIRERDELKKFFLHDGAYNHSHIIQLGANYNFRRFNLPLEVYGNLGFVYSYFTLIDSALYTRTGKAENVNRKTKSYKVDTQEYPIQKGIVFTLGLKFKL